MSTVDSLKGKVADEVAEDAEFAKKLKPELMQKRLKGELPTDQTPGEPQRAPRPAPEKPKKGGGGVNPFVVVGVALATGIALAKAVDWRGHAHPRF
jgi:hypothetical protein